MAPVVRAVRSTRNPGAVRGFRPLPEPGAPNPTTPDNAALVCTASNYQGYDTPDAADLDLTAGVDLRILLQPARWSQSCDLFGKWFGATDLSFLFQLIAGNLQFFYSTTGADALNLFSTAAVSTGGPVWLRVVVDALTGGVTTGTFYTSVDGSAWTQLGSPVTNTVGPFHSGASIVEVGTQTDSGNFTGDIFKAEVWNLAGTFIAGFDATNLATVTTYTDATGHVWSPQMNATIAAKASNGTTYTDSGTIPLTVALSGADQVASVDAGTIPVTTALSGADQVASTDSGTIATGAVTLAGADSQGGNDAGTIPLSIALAGADLVTSSDAGTIPVTLAASGADQVASNDAGTIPLSIALAGADAAAYGETGQIPLTLSLVGADQVASADSGAIPLTIILGGLEVFEVPVIPVDIVDRHTNRIVFDQ